MKEISIFDDKIKSSINNLANIIRAERNRNLKPVETYAEPNLIDKFINVSNQVIFGRRGTGKTHLLYAIREKLNDEFPDNHNLGIYCDLNTVIPLIEEKEDNRTEYCLLIIQGIIEEIIKSVIINLSFINESDSYNSQSFFEKLQETELQMLLDKFNLALINGKEIKSIGKYRFSKEDISNFKTSLNISPKEPGINITDEKQNKEKSSDEQIKYISIADLHKLLNKLFELVDNLQITLLLDEFSEVNKENQPYLAALIKRILISANGITIKIAAIPNRTSLQLRNTNIIGLEEGADIFGFHLDNRYIYETNKIATKNFFNTLLANHLNSIAPGVFHKTGDNLLNLFLAPQAMNEILIATAGISRDFLNIFINSYDDCLVNHKSTQTRISVQNIRKACRAWYNTDKKEQVEKNTTAHTLLAQILSDIVVGKKSSHFLVPQKYTEIKAFQDLIDFRVVHLRKDNYSHKDNKGVIYNVYSVDYSSYNSLDLTKNSLETFEDIEINTADDFRKIRRISLEASFFDKFLLEVGDGIKCKHCSGTVDINSQLYIKRKLCTHCYDPLD